VTSTAAATPAANPAPAHRQDVDVDGALSVGALRQLADCGD
jgi:hypothetical protein